VDRQSGALVQPFAAALGSNHGEAIAVRIATAASLERRDRRTDMSYDWNLMLRLLREAQKSGNETFTPRQYADEHALALEEAGQPMPNMDSLKAEAQNYESALFEGGFMVARPEEQGGNGENFVLTDRGVRLMEMLEGGPGGTANRQRLDEKGEAALVPEVFDGLAAG